MSSTKTEWLNDFAKMRGSWNVRIFYSKRHRSWMFTYNGREDAPYILAHNYYDREDVIYKFYMDTMVIVREEVDSNNITEYPIQIFDGKLHYNPGSRAHAKGFMLGNLFQKAYMNWVDIEAEIEMLGINHEEKENK